jgi:hypothetical protein
MRCDALRLVRIDTKYDLLEIQNQVDDVFNDAFDSRELVLDTVDANRRDGGTRDARQQRASHGVSERITEARLQWLDDEL